MNGWPVRKLSSVLRVQNGFAFDSKRFSAEGGMPLIRIRDLKNGRSTETNFDGGFDSRYVVTAGDLLIGMDGEFGCYEWRGPDALLNQRVCKLADFAADIEPRFLFYGINKYLKEIEQVTAYTTVKHLSSRQIANIEFPLPPLEEQRRIVAVLDEAFTAIATATANAAKNLANAREFFGSYLESRFEEAKLGAKTKPLEQLCVPDRVITYGVIKLGEHVPDGVPCLRTSNVRWLDFNLEGMKYIEPGLSSEYRRTVLRGGEILVNVRGTLGGVAVASQSMAGWNVSREVAVVPCDISRIDPQYLAYWIGTRTSQGWLAHVEKGVAYTGINIGDLRSLPVVLLPIEEQRKIVAELDSSLSLARDMECSFRSKIEMLNKLKQSLLRRGFSGELTEAEPLAA